MRNVLAARTTVTVMREETAALPTAAESIAIGGFIELKGVGPGMTRVEMSSVDEDLSGRR